MDNGAEARIEALIRAFEDGSLKRDDWTHTAHLIVALWYVRLLPVHAATSRIRTGIRRLNAIHGNSTGYHETITLAWIAVVTRFLDNRDRNAPLSDLATALIDNCGRKDYLLRFYSRDLLMSEAARMRWVPPDREDFS